MAGTYQPDKWDWEKVREGWLAHNLDPQRERDYLLRDAAKEHGIPYGTVRNRAAAEDWRGQLREHARALTDVAVARVRDAYAFDEAEVRLRQQRIARLASDYAEQLLLARIEKGEVAGDDEGADLREVMALARLGLEQERKALGLPDEFRVQAPGLTDPGAESPMMRIQRSRRMAELAADLEARRRDVAAD